jgi:hypothetical protein
MKRIFVIEGFHKAAPALLTETPPTGSKVTYNHTLYRVADVVYYFEQNSVHIMLAESADVNYEQ